LLRQFELALFHVGLAERHTSGYGVLLFLRFAVVQRAMTGGLAGGQRHTEGGQGDQSTQHARLLPLSGGETPPVDACDPALAPSTARRRRRYRRRAYAAPWSARRHRAAFSGNRGSSPRRNVRTACR